MEKLWKSARHRYNQSKVARAITLFVEVFGFEVVRVKRSGRKKSSIRLIRHVLGGAKPKPALHLNGSGEPNGYFTVNVGCDACIKHMKSALALVVKESLSLEKHARRLRTTPRGTTPRAF